jgi:hypothetical protein
MSKLIAKTRVPLPLCLAKAKAGDQTIPKHKTLMRTISEMILRQVYRTVLSKGTRRSLTFLSQVRVLLALVDRRPPVESINEFSDKSILVLAPHMDDEVLGCGGILRRHVLGGAQVIVVYMTDGRRGNPELSQRIYPREP